MDTKIVLILFGLIIIFISYGCECEEDEFGEVLRLEIPVDVGAENNLFQVGDTLWLTSRFSKSVEVVDHPNDIELVGFDFFSSLYISEISESELRSYQTGNVVISTGEVVLNELGGYDYTFAEDDTSYFARFGVVLSIPGFFTTSSNTNVFEQSDYRHPALFTCEDNLRMNLFIDRPNRFSTTTNFDDFGRWNLVQSGFLQTFEGYVGSGKFTFQVVE